MVDVIVVYVRHDRGAQRAAGHIAPVSWQYHEVRPHYALIPIAGGDVVMPRDVYAEKIMTQIPRWQARAREAKRRLDDPVAFSS